ncbi:unnamed protein product [Moneuplotes crassus]|uniref:Uncharacterized protein n=1 Tax=Euplotes crassus TaxID=5936 RepID=A0AAD1XP05_EUPCR|nr:unnamed protein product [Moneuplotes crassus]
MIEKVVFKEENKYGRQCFGNMKERLGYKGWARYRGDHILEFIPKKLCYQQYKFEYVKLRQDIRGLGNIQTALTNDKMNFRFLKRLFEESMFPKKINKWEIHSSPLINKFILRAGIKNICQNASNVTQRLALLHFRLGPTHVDKIIMSGRHLKFIFFYFCEIANQKGRRTFKTYNMSSSGLEIQISNCHPSQSSEEKPALRVIKNIMNGIMNSRLHPLESQIPTCNIVKFIKFFNMTPCTAEEIDREVNYPELRDKVVVTKYEVLFNLQ